MKLVIAEKPSVAKSLAHVLGARTYKNGYFEGKDLRVSWCYGHLIELANPEAYDPKYKHWNLKDLPIMPDHYQYEVSKGSAKKQFSVLKKLMNDKQVTAVVNACDAGREGESIFRLVYLQAKCKKPMYRLWTSSLEDSALKQAFANLQPGKKFDNLFIAAQARAFADWLVGMNLSRFYTCTYHTLYTVGRVQTPTVGIIAARDKEIENFKKEKYYSVKIELDDFSLSSERIDDMSAASALVDSLQKQGSIKLDSISQKEKTTKPDKPYDLTTLQREANKKYGMTAQETLDVLQSLYEKKLTSYPRTDSRYFTNDMKETIRKLVSAFDSHFEMDDRNFDKLFDSSKVSDHYAIIPTLSAAQTKLSELNLSEREQHIFDLVLHKLLCAVAHNLVESVTTLTYHHESYKFSSSEKVVLNPGWERYSILSSADYDILRIPDLLPDQMYLIKNVVAEEKYTQPKKHYTEDTLLRAMETAGVEALKDDVEVERKGLGTPATRAGIIENIIMRGFIKRDKKRLICTDKGYKLLKVVSPRFKSAEMTSEWENQLSSIAHGTYSGHDFLNTVQDEITQVIRSIRALT